MEKLSVVIITKNEEKNIERCLQSVSWADEIVVLDSGSTDKTPMICEKYHCRFERTEWLGFGPTKQKAVGLATNIWILSIDADEEVSPELKSDIQQIMKSDAAMRKDAYKIKRKSWYVNAWVNHCGWNKDYPLRLFDKNRAKFNSKLIHEAVETSGTVGTLNTLLYHYTYPTLDSHIDKMKFYGHLTADRKTNEGKHGSIAAALFHGGVKFIRMYLFKAGFLDGTTGFVLALNSAFGVYYKHLLLWERSATRGLKS